MGHLSTGEAVNGPTVFYEEVLVHAETFLATGSATQSDHPAVNSDLKKVEKEVETNASTPNEDTS
jgi:hypothetical protein